MDIDPDLPFWPKLVAVIDAAEARTFKLFGLDADCVRRGNTAAIVPLVMLAIAFAVLVFAYAIQSFMIKRQNPKPAGLEDWDFPQFDDGTPQAVAFGDVWTEGPMICWYGNYRTKKIKSGGKK